MRHTKRFAALLLAGLLAVGGVLPTQMPVSAATNKTSSVPVPTEPTAQELYQEMSCNLSSYKPISGLNNTSILAADFSNYQQDLAWKKIYYDYKGNVLNENQLFSYVKKQGINTISVNVLVDPVKNENKYMDLTNGIKTILAAKKAGLKTNMTLLYSDDMTYGNDQSLPASWSKSINTTDPDAVTNKALSYTENVLSTLRQKNAMPDQITIGNEIDYNFLTLDGNWYSWKAMADISWKIKAAGAKVGVSLYANPDDPTNIQWVMDKLNDTWAPVQYDTVGVNIYPYSGFDEAAYVKQARETFQEKAKEGSQFIVSKIQYSRKSETDTKCTVANQAANVYNLLKATVSEENAGGIIYDGAENVGNWKSFINEYGMIVPSLSVFAAAKGEKYDNSITLDPWKYGGDTGLKEQKVSVKKIKNMSQSTIRGMDASSYIALKKAGVKYYNYAGKEESMLKIMADNGINYLRIRIWNDPYNAKGETYGGGNNDVETGLELAKEAAKYNMKVLLCFHYSDFWADPGQQIVPKAWKKYASKPAKMSKNVYKFTKKTIEKFKKTGVEIGMVQVGNEITNGMLGVNSNRDKGESYKAVWGNAKKSAIVNRYLKAGIKAVRETVPSALVALHLESPNVKKYETIMKTWKRDGVDYDILGSSWYPFWRVKSKTNTTENLKKIQNLAASYDKFFVVLETSWPNSLKDGDGKGNSIGEEANTSAFPIGPQGQVDELTALYQTLTSNKNNNGLGAFYWEGGWIPVRPGWINWDYNTKMSNLYGTGWAAQGAVGYFPNSKMYYKGQPSWGASSWENQAFFDLQGHALQSLRFYKDSVSKGKQQLIIITPCDSSGKQVGNVQFAQIPVGKTTKIKLASVPGYAPEKAKLSVKGTKKGVKKYKAVYKVATTKSSYDYKVKVVKKNYTLFKNTSLYRASTKVYNKTYVAKNQVHHKNGTTYVELYTLDGDYVGLISKKAVKNLKKVSHKPQGKAKKYNKQVTIKKKYTLYKNFDWKKSKTKLGKKTYVAKYRYTHWNGNTYLALYRKGKFVGYINKKYAKIK